MKKTNLTKKIAALFAAATMIVTASVCASAQTGPLNETRLLSVGETGPLNETEPLDETGPLEVRVRSQFGVRV